MSDIINDFLEDIPANSAGGSSGGRGKYERMLEPEVIALLDEFVELLEADGKTKATAQSYRSGVAKALALRQPWAQQTSDQHSAGRAFKKLMNLS